MASSGELVQPDPTLMADPEHLYRLFMQVYGLTTGSGDWGAAVSHTSFDDDAEYAHTDRNHGTGGGGLHYEALHSATGSPVVQITDAGLHLLGSSAPFLVGSIVDYAGAGTPTGWLLCDGASLSRSAYPALFAAIGTTWGAADGSHFTLPDLRGRVRLGVSGSHALNDTGGSETHQHDISDHSHTISDHSHSLPTHRHDEGSLQADGTTEVSEQGAIYDEDETGNGHTTRDADHVHELHDIPLNGFTGDGERTASPGSAFDKTNDKTGMVTHDKTGMVTQSGSTMMPFATVRPLIYAGA